jgi:hypothetical protein
MAFRSSTWPITHQVEVGQSEEPSTSPLVALDIAEQRTQRPHHVAASVRDGSHLAAATASPVPGTM